MNSDEQQFWMELRRAEHEKRGAVLRDARKRFDGLANRVIVDEPKAAPASKAVAKASEAMAACRYPLEDIAAKEFDDPFALKAFDTRGPDPTEVEPSERESGADEWLDRDCWWSPAQAVAVSRADRAKVLEAAQRGLIGVRADKHTLMYRARDVVDFVDGRKIQ